MSPEAILARAVEAHRQVLLAERVVAERQQDLLEALAPLRRNAEPRLDEPVRQATLSTYYEQTEAAEDAERERHVMRRRARA